MIYLGIWHGIRVLENRQHQSNPAKFSNWGVHHSSQFEAFKLCQKKIWSANALCKIEKWLLWGDKPWHPISVFIENHRLKLCGRLLSSYRGSRILSAYVFLQLDSMGWAWFNLAWLWQNMHVSAISSWQNVHGSKLFC